MIFADTPSICDSSLGTSLRGERRAGRPSASARATDSRKLSRVTGRSIHVTSRGTVFERLAGFADDDQRAVGAEQADEARTGR